MKITLFTSNNLRHNYFVNLLSQNCDELFVVQESKTVFTGINPGRYPVSKVIQNYFESVEIAQNKIFPNSRIVDLNNKCKVLPLAYDDLNKCTLKFLSPFLKSDLFIIFGSSYIKGELVDFLIKKKALNIHMGVSPYYKGTDCNFWALFDDNPHLVGSTIHLLSKGLDSGDILYHAMSNIKSNAFDYTMSTVKSAFISIVNKIKDETIFNTKPFIQDSKKKIRYSKKIEFNDKIVTEYFKKKIDLNKKKFDTSLLKNPFFLNE